MINFTEEELLRQRLANAESIISDYVEFVNELCYALPDMQDDDAAAEALIVAEVEGIVEENAELKAERRKFTECTSSNGCFDHDGNLHVHNGEFMSPSGVVNGQIFPRVAKLVWHREP